ncbi:transporter substrate-binding domain-containing protein, partial [Oleiphilus sp. HI0067]
VIGMNWAQAQEQILKGGVDALLHINTNPEREKILDFSTELVVSEFHLFVHRDSNFDENNIDLNNMIIGVEAKGYPYSYLKRNDIPLALVSSWEEGMRGVINGDIDAVLVDHLVGMNTIFNSRIANLKSISSPLPKSYSRIAVKKGNDLILDQINKGLAILYADGTIDRSIKNWMTPSIQMVEQLWHEQERVKTQNIGLIILSLLTLLCLIAFVKSRMTISSELDKNKDLNRALKGAYTELQDKNEALADANQNLETFVSLASHDMRAPLNGMKNLIQWAEEDLATDNHNNVREHLSLLKSRSTRLSNLLSDLLIFFRADKHSADDNKLIDPNLCARELVNNFDSPLNVNIIIAPNA